MYYITDMSAMQTKNKKNKEIYLLPFLTSKTGKNKGCPPQGYASGNENSKIKTRPEHSRMAPNYETTDRRR